MAVSADYDIVRGIEALTLKPVGQNFDPPLSIGSRHAPRSVFARVETSLPVHGIPVCSVRSFTKDLGTLAGNVLVDPVDVVIAEQQESFPRPHRPLTAREAHGDRLDLKVLEILRGQQSR